jgi:menaquinone-dependent protoporphyrinogen oxidase
MANVLIVYGTTEGHTAKIASFIADVGRNAGHDVEVRHGGLDGAGAGLGAFDAIIVGASVHETRHQKYIREFIRSHREWLEKIPSAFFQVCLTSVKRDEEHVRQATEVVEHMTRETGWKPARVGLFAGALLYTQYNWMKRFVLKLIVKREGGDLDTSKDYEYTDWEQVRVWSQEFFGSLASSPRANA